MNCILILSESFRMNFQDLTIIIPTKNRSNFVNSLLQYYNKIHFNSKIIIADSSDENNFQKIEDNKISSIDAKFKNLHLNTRNLGVTESILDFNYLKSLNIVLNF